MKYRDVKEYYRIIIIEYTNEIENESNLKRVCETFSVNS